MAKTASRKNRIHSLLTPSSRVGFRPHQQREGLAVPELVVAPLFEPAEDRVELPLRVALELAIDGDVSCVSDLLGQIGGVEDELRPKVGVFLGPGQEAKVHPDAEFLQGLVDEAGVASFVAAHEGEEFADGGVLHPFLDLRIEHAARELGRDRGDQKIEEFAPQPLGQAVDVGMPIIRADEVLGVRVATQLRHQCVPLGPHPVDVEPVHGGEVGGVETGAEDGVLLGLPGGLVGCRMTDRSVHRSLRGVKLTS